MSKYSIKTVILFYISISAFILIFSLGVFVIFNHTKSLERDLMNKMTIMSEDIAAHRLYAKSSKELKTFFILKSNNHKESFHRYINNISFRYVESMEKKIEPLSVIKLLPNKNYIIVTSSSTYIDKEVNKLLVQLVLVLLLIFGMIMLGLNLLLTKLLSPLKCLVNYCNNSPLKSGVINKCEGSYEVNTLKQAILKLQGTNQKLCQEKQDIFKEAAHEMKSPIAILKARLALFSNDSISKQEFVKDTAGDISSISNKVRELIFLKAIEWDIKQAKESVQIQSQCSLMQQLFRPILEKKKPSNDFE